MRVIVNIKQSGSRDGVDWPERGEEIDLSDEEAVAYLKSGICVAKRDNKVEIAVDPKMKSERAVIK